MNLGKENETTEFKETASELRQALMDMSAILNKHGKRLLYFGAKDWGDACWMQKIGKTKLALNNAVEYIKIISILFIFVL